MRIETKRLILRDFAEMDADALFELKYDPQVVEYIPDFLERDVTREQIPAYIEKFRALEAAGETESWRIYAIELKQTGEVVGSLSFGENSLLHEYGLGWQMLSRHTKNGYASEAVEAFAEHFCARNGVDYLIAVMDTDNPASYRTAEKSGFRLFEKRTVFDWSYNRYGDDYYYLRRYVSSSALSEKFYGDVPYEGR